jgi:hypothetical protein
MWDMCAVVHIIVPFLWANRWWQSSVPGEGGGAESGIEMSGTHRGFCMGDEHVRLTKRSCSLSKATTEVL